MAKELAVEFKTLLSKTEYLKLSKLYGDKQSNLQINYYFDTPRFTLKASDIGLRIRKREKYEITLKRKKGYVLQEINEEITEEQFNDFVKTGNIPSESIKNELSEIIKEQAIVNYMSLSTFRISVPLKSGKIAIDKCVYVDKKDYELEFETNAPYEQAKREFIELVKDTSGDTNQRFFVNIPSTVTITNLTKTETKLQIQRIYR